MSTKKKKGGLLPLLGKFVLGLFFLVIVVGLLMWLAGVFEPKIDATHAAEAPVDLVPADARTAVVSLVSMPAYERAVGTVEPTLEASVASRILSRVVEMRVSPGQKVERGAVLVRLDSVNLEERIAQARAGVDAQRAQVDQAREELTRSQRAFDENVASELTVIRARNGLRSAEAGLVRAQRAVEEAQAVLGYATVTAPFSGTVIEESVDVGDTVTPGQPLLKMYDPEKMQLVASVRESLSARLEIGTFVTAEVESLGIVCQAMVAEIVPEALSDSRSFRVKVTGPCPPGVYPGMFGRIEIPLDDTQRLIVPASCITQVGQLDLVRVVIERDGKRIAQTRSVQQGQPIGDGTVEILSGLRAGEVVLISSRDDGGTP